MGKLTISHIEAGFRQLDDEERALRYYFSGERGEGGDVGLARRDRHGQRRPQKHRFSNCLQVRRQQRRGRSTFVEALKGTEPGDATDTQRTWASEGVVADTSGNGLDSSALVGSIARVNEKAKKRIYDTVLRRSQAFKGLVAEAVGEGRSPAGRGGNLLPGGAYPTGEDAASPRSFGDGDDSDDHSIDEAFVLELLKGDPAGGELFARRASTPAGAGAGAASERVRSQHGGTSPQVTPATRARVAGRQPPGSGAGGAGGVDDPDGAGGGLWGARPATADVPGGGGAFRDTSILRPSAAATRRFRSSNPNAAPYVRKLFRKIERAADMRPEGGGGGVPRDAPRKQVVTCLRGRPIVPPVTTPEQLASYKFSNRKALRMEKPSATAAHAAPDRKMPLPRSVLLHRKEYYFIHIRILINDASLLRWRFRVTFTDITSPESPHVASFAPLRADENSYIIFEEPNNCIFSPVDHLGWVAAPYDLYGHTLRVEVVGIQPTHTKVVDSLIYFGETPPGDTGDTTDAPAGDGTPAAGAVVQQA